MPASLRGAGRGLRTTAGAQPCRPASRLVARRLMPTLNADP